MRRLLLSGLAGGLFGVGLAIAGMTQPSKVIGFLDVTGNWDPSLALVMVGAIGVFAPMYRLLTARPRAALGLTWSLPNRSDIDARLVIGAALFGIGWGLAGFCPGPGIVAAATGQTAPLLFAGCMVFGMIAFEMLHGVRVPTSDPTDSLTGQSPAERTAP